MRNRNLITAFFLIAAVVLFSHPGAHAASQPGEENALCLGCHGNGDMSLAFGNGEKLRLFVDARNLAGSAHRNLGCRDCHGFSMDKHPHRQFKSRRAFTASSSEMCRQCHNFKKGIHYKMLASLKETVCVDCHGSHAIKPVSDDVDACYGCHKYGIAMTCRDGSRFSLTLPEDALKLSVHSKLRCADCHFGFSAKTHPERNFANRRDFTIVSTEICRRCHFDKYTKTLESIHFNMISKGNLNAPVCVDCHGSHTITAGRHEKVRSARRCERCHEAIYQMYAMSVHGQALLSDNNKDVPVCADCHMAHDISDPRLVNFRNNIPQMCGNCHANKELMKKYGLSTAVLQSYLEDFHGVTLTFYKKQEGPVRHIAVCIDCHGIHDITKVKGPNATVLKANLVKRCRKCHPGAAENFPDSWISHYEPNFKRAPLVYAINLVYSIFIPFMIVGLILQIILHIWRYAVNR
jgi:predicted CXXCH cytochrome family protein